MWLEYKITDPLRLSEVKIITPTEMKEYLDLCSEFGSDFTREQCLKYWQEHRNMYGDMRPKRVDYRFLKAMQNGATIWHNTKFYQKTSPKSSASTGTH